MISLPRFQHDKLTHFAYGAVIASVLTILQVLLIGWLHQHVDLIKCTWVHWAPVASLGVVVAMAIATEVLQKLKGGTNSPREMLYDALATSAGGLTSVSTTLAIYLV